MSYLNIVYFLIAFLDIPALCICVVDTLVSFVLVCSPFLLIFCVENREMVIFWAPVIYYSLSSLPSFAEMLFFTFTLSSNITIFCFSMLSSPPGMLAGAQAKVRMGAAGLVRY